MHLDNLNRGELVAVVGGALLGVTLALSWFTLGNAHAVLSSCHGPHTSCSGWTSLQIMRYIFLLTAAAPAILAYIILRGHALSWPRGELTALTAILALVLIVFRGLLDKPGTPTGEISVDYGWWLGLLGAILILIGSLWRSQESGPRRKPPGVL